MAGVDPKSVAKLLKPQPRELREGFELCKLDMCPAKKTCLRHAAGGIAPSSALPERYGAFAIMPGEKRCPNFMSLNAADRFYEPLPVPVAKPAEPPKVLSTPKTVVWLQQLDAELQQWNVATTLKGGMTLHPNAFEIVLKLARNHKQILRLAIAQAIREVKEGK